MNQLTVGQRIDVYEVVKDEVGNTHGFKLRTYLAAEDLSFCHPKAETEYLIRPIKKHCLRLRPEEVQKCGYYLKVKSLKGGNNE